MVTSCSCSIIYSWLLFVDAKIKNHVYDELRMRKNENDLKSPSIVRHFCSIDHHLRMPCFNNFQRKSLVRFKSGVSYICIYMWGSSNHETPNKIRRKRDSNCRVLFNLFVAERTNMNVR